MRYILGKQKNKVYLFVLGVEEDGRVYKSSPLLDSRGKVVDEGLKLVRAHPNFLGVALPRSSQLLRRAQQLFRVRVRVL